MALLAADGTVLAQLLTAYVAIATAAGTALWAVTKYLADRRVAREQQHLQAIAQLEQRQAEEVRARQQRAAELVKAVGDATEDRPRRWTMSALSLYPDEALDLLLNSLGEATPQDAAAIKIAVISIGAKALPRTVRAHRIARQICRTGETEGVPEGAPIQRQVDTETAEKVLDCTRAIILQLLFQLTEPERAAVDLAHVDLTGVSLAGARLSRLSLRKAHLDRAVLVKASLNHAVLRGATLDGAALRAAHLREADLTGASGAIHAIGIDLTKAVLDHATLAGADLSAAHLQNASMIGTDLTAATVAGAGLGGATLTGAHLGRIVGKGLKAAKVAAVNVDLSHAGLADAQFQGATFDHCTLVALVGPRLKVAEATFGHCNFGGAHLGQASLTRTQFRDCNLGGVDLTRADLSGAVLEGCGLCSTKLVHATLVGVRFVRCRFSGAVDFTGTDLSTVTFADCEFTEGARLVVDNDTWTGISAPEARAGFERALAHR